MLEGSPSSATIQWLGEISIEQEKVWTMEEIYWDIKEHQARENSDFVKLESDDSTIKLTGSFEFGFRTVRNSCRTINSNSYDSSCFPFDRIQF